MIASICLPVNHQTSLKGVLCIDQSLEELLSELLFRQSGGSSYYFMVDIYTRVLDHPMVQNPTEITDHPKFTFLRTLEIGDKDKIDYMVEKIIK